MKLLSMAFAAIVFLVVSVIVMLALLLGLLTKGWAALAVVLLFVGILPQGRSAREHLVDTFCILFVCFVAAMVILLGEIGLMSGAVQAFLVILTIVLLAVGKGHFNGVRRSYRLGYRAGKPEKNRSSNNTQGELEQAREQQQILREAEEREAVRREERARYQREVDEWIDQSWKENE
jgi:signal transduction histidine kinase